MGAAHLGEGLQIGFDGPIGGQVADGVQPKVLDKDGRLLFGPGRVISQNTQE